MQLPHGNSGEKDDIEKSHELIFVNEPINSGEGSGVIANGTMSSTVQEPDFSEFMWMATEDLEAFDRKVISELDEHLGIDSGVGFAEEEEEFLQLMLDEEEERDTVYFASHSNVGPDGAVRELSSRMHRMDVTDGIAAQSTLNPFAAEFIPSQGLQNSNSVNQTITVMSQPNSHQMMSQLYASTIGTLQNNGVNNVQQNLSPALQAQNIMWRQNSPQISSRYNGPVQINGHEAMRRLYGNASNMPMYVSNVPVFPMVNGGPFIRPQQNRFHIPDSERSTEDEGYH